MAAVSNYYFISHNEECEMLNKKASFEVYDMKGQIVLNRTNVQSFDVSALEKGTYLIHTTEQETIKIIVQ